MKKDRGHLIPTKKVDQELGLPKDLDPEIKKSIRRAYRLWSKRKKAFAARGSKGASLHSILTIYDLLAGLMRAHVDPEWS